MSSYSAKLLNLADYYSQSLSVDILGLVRQVLVTAASVSERGWQAGTQTIPSPLTTRSARWFEQPCLDEP